MAVSFYHPSLFPQDTFLEVEFLSQRLVSDFKSQGAARSLQVTSDRGSALQRLKLIRSQLWSWPCTSSAVLRREQCGCEGHECACKAEKTQARLRIHSVYSASGFQESVCAWNSDRRMGEARKGLGYQVRAVWGVRLGQIRSKTLELGIYYTKTRISKLQ